MHALNPYLINSLHNLNTDPKPFDSIPFRLVALPFRPFQFLPFGFKPGQSATFDQPELRQNLPEFYLWMNVSDAILPNYAWKSWMVSRSILEPMVVHPWNSSPHLDRLLVQNENVSDCVQVLNSHQDSWWGIYMVRAALRALLCAVCESWVATLWCACNLLLSEAKLPCTYYLHWLRYMAQSWSGRHLDQTSAAGSWTTCQPQTSGKSPRLSTRQCASQVVRANLERW